MLLKNNILTLTLYFTFTLLLLLTFNCNFTLTCQKVFPFFLEKIPRLIKPFTWVLLNHLKKGPKFIEPEKVKLATESYRKRMI